MAALVFRWMFMFDNLMTWEERIRAGNKKPPTSFNGKALLVDGIY